MPNEANRDTGTLLKVRLTTGRGIWCFRYVVAYTYDGFLERTPSEKCNRHMLERAKREAVRVFGDWPVHVVEPARATGALDFPKVRFTAFFTSLPMSEEMDVSSLVLIWFQDEQFPPLNESSLSAVQAVDWERLATDYEL